MIIVEGYIDSIRDVQSPEGYDKKRVTLKMKDRQQAFVEVRSERALKELKDIKSGDRVAFTVRLEGKVSRLSGQEHNNLIAQSVTLSNP